MIVTLVMGLALHQAAAQPADGAVSRALGLNASTAYWLGVCDRIGQASEQNAEVSAVLTLTELRANPSAMMAGRVSAAEAYAGGRMDRFTPTGESCRDQRAQKWQERNTAVEALAASYGATTAPNP